MRNIGLAFALAATCFAVTPALAGDAKLAWNDLDLTTDAGKAELDRRIGVAAREICAPRTVTGTIITNKASASCLEEARTAITAKVAAKTGHQVAGRTAGGPAMAEARR